MYIGAYTLYFLFIIMIYYFITQILFTGNFLINSLYGDITRPQELCLDPPHLCHVLER